MSHGTELEMQRVYNGRCPRRVGHHHSLLNRSLFTKQITLHCTTHQPTTMTSPPESHQAQIAAALSSLWAPPQVLSVLTDLHTRALAEEPFVSSSSSSLSSTHAASLDKFVALDPDKCALVYLLARAARARVIVEAGTSFGVSTIYLALAVAQNNGGGGDGGGDGRVIATELEPHKAAAACENWRRAGDQVSGVVDLREGDILDTLARDVPEVDFLLLDSKSPPPPPNGLLGPSETRRDETRRSKRSD